ncbi:putative quinol monooxygenase [Rhizobium sp. Root1204]|uniref:putative quinol monooxygenase n=1 Tax=Rhizobium sp. Root1204 TaxID=1736428 RepID=UPI00071377EF|nr:putative quinol monooxygenase [Rhizobium sp. Root1204]KQV37025.1 hypothetical protein ASC96_26760 [Rhizobium sp. Root1204]
MTDTGVFHVVAVCVAKPGLEVTVREVFERLVPDALTERGCLKYTLHVDREDPARFVFVEAWADRRALEDHLATDVSRALAQKLNDLLLKPASLTAMRQIA